MSKKIAIVIGHASDNKGACSKLGIPCEWDYNSKVAKYLEDIADIYVYDGYSRGYTSMVTRNAAKVNLNDYLIVLELHYNFYDLPSANGTEVLYWATSIKGKEYATALSKQIAEDFKTVLRNGGILSSKDTDRGLVALKSYKAPTLIVEPFFGSSPSDVAKFKGQEAAYAISIRKFISKTFKICS